MEAADSMKAMWQDMEAFRMDVESQIAELRHGDGGSEARLIDVLRGDDEWQRALAARALGEMRSRLAVPALRDLRRHSDGCEFCIFAATLGDIGDPAAVEDLVFHLDNAEHLADVNADRIKAGFAGNSLCAKLNRFLLRRWIGEISESERTTMRLLYVRYAARALGMIGDPRAVEPLMRRANDPDQATQRMVHDARTRIQGTSAGAF